jgi:LPS sulfotransferase NodH
MRFFFISGAHKSGTSWLANMMRAHPEIGMPAEEMWFFGHPKSLAGNNLQTAIDKWFTLPTVAKEFPKPAATQISIKLKTELVAAVLRMYKTPKTRALGDKTPLLTLRAAKDIRKYFPNAYLFVIYRDGRDVAVSHHFHNLRLKDFRNYADSAEGEAAYRRHIEGASGEMPLLHRATLEEVGRNWVNSNVYAKAARDEFGERFLMVSYEDLWENPVPFLTSAFTGLGVTVDKELIEEIVRSKSFAAVAKGRTPGVQDPKSFYRTGRPGDWRNYFDPQSAALFNEIAGEWLLKLGYATTLDWQKEV